MSLFRKKKSLEKISLGELHIIKAEIETIRDHHTSVIKELNKDIQKVLSLAVDEPNTEFLTKKLSYLVRMKSESVDARDLCERKILAVDKLTRAKEQSQILPKNHPDILDLLDIDAFIEEQDIKKVKDEIQDIRLNKILDTENEDDTTIINDILHSVQNGESIDVAKYELEQLILKQTYK